jgi:hypothetical protein
MGGRLRMRSGGEEGQWPVAVKVARLVGKERERPGTTRSAIEVVSVHVCDGARGCVEQAARLSGRDKRCVIVGRHGVDLEDELQGVVEVDS